MRALVWCVLFASLAAEADAGQRPRQPRSTAPAEPNSASTATADAYNQFLLARRLERDSDIDGAIAAYKRAATLDPSSGEIPAALAALYMGQNRAVDAINTAEQALKISPSNSEAHRVLGVVYAALSDADTKNARGTASSPADENAKKAINHLEQALKDPDGEPDPNLLANLARMYVRTQEYDKAIPMLRSLVSREHGWLEGLNLLAEVYAGAGKNADAITWLESAVEDDPRLYATLGDFYDRERRWKDAAGAYAQAAQRAPRNIDLKLRYASALLSTGERANSQKARDLLAEVVSSRPTDQRALYLLSQAHRRASDPANAEAAARRLIGLNKQSPWGYYALAEALQDRQQYKAVVDALLPVTNEMRSRSTPDVSGLGLLLPHLGFSYRAARPVRLGHRVLRRSSSAVAGRHAGHRLPDSGSLVGQAIRPGRRACAGGAGRAP